LHRGSRAYNNWSLIESGQTMDTRSAPVAPNDIIARLRGPGALRHAVIFCATAPVMAGAIWLMGQFLIAEGAITLAAFPVALAVVGTLALGPAVAVAWALTLYGAFVGFYGIAADWAVPYALLYGLAAWATAIALRRLNCTDPVGAPLRAFAGWYLVVGFTAPIITTLVGVPMLVAGGGAEIGADLWLLMVSNFISDSFSPVSVGFALFVIFETTRRQGSGVMFSGGIDTERTVWLVVAAIASLAVVVFGTQWTRAGMNDATPAFYLLLAWAALRFSQSFAAIATATVGLLIISCTTFGLGGTPIPQSTFDALGQYANLLALTVLAQGSSAMTVQRARDSARALKAELDRARLKRYFSPRLVDDLLRRPDTADRTRRQQVVVMFADIVGSTGLVEAQKPEESIVMLRDFDTAMAERVFAHGGVIDKFLGDGLMAVFGLPELGPCDARDAVVCAFEMLEAAERLAADRRARGLAGYRLSIGLHSGEVIAGNVGSENNLSFTVIGDTVNVASRLESLSRELDASIVTSDAVIDRARHEMVTTERPMLERFVHQPAHIIRGRRSEVGIWTVPYEPKSEGNSPSPRPIALEGTRAET